MQLYTLHHLNEHLSYLSQKIPDTPLYAVGGCVRDLFLGRTDSPTDIDITAPGEPDAIRSRVRRDESEFSFFHTEKFGTMTLIPKNDSQIQYELTPLRTESGYSNSRHPDEISRSSDLVLDSHRRDFTINALYYTTVTFPQIKAGEAPVTTQATDLTPLTKQLDKQGIAYSADHHILIIQSEALIKKAFADGKADKTFLFALTKTLSPDSQPRQIGVLLDPTGGWADFHNRKIRAVGNPDQRIHEDALRVIRALRFAIQLDGYDFDKTTWLALQKRYFQIKDVANERIIQEIMKVLHTGNFFGFVALMDEINILHLIFPSVERIKHVDQPIRYHPFDVYAHTMLVLWHLEQISDDPLLKLAALYHDVGKRDQYHMQSIKMSIEDGRKMYGSRLNHANCGSDYAHRDMKILGLSKKQCETIARYVQMHMRPGEIMLSNESKRKHKLRLLLSEAGYDRVRNLLDLTVADMRGQYNPLQTDSLERIFRLKEILEELNTEEGQFTIKDLAINGRDIMEHFSIEPGPEIKNRLQTAFERVLKDIDKRNTKRRILKHLDSQFNS